VPKAVKQNLYKPTGLGRWPVVMVCLWTLPWPWPNYWTWVPQGITTPLVCRSKEKKNLCGENVAASKSRVFLYCSTGDTANNWTAATEQQQQPRSIVLLTRQGASATEQVAASASPLDSSSGQSTWRQCRPPSCASSH